MRLVGLAVACALLAGCGESKTEKGDCDKAVDKMVAILGASVVVGAPEEKSAAVAAWVKDQKGKTPLRKALADTCAKLTKAQVDCVIAANDEKALAHCEAQEPPTKKGKN